MNKKVHVYSPSYKRPHLCVSHKLFEPELFSYVVRESDSAGYLEKFENVLIIPDHLDGSIAKARNWILGNKISEYVTMVDDDLEYIGRWFRNEDGIKKLKRLDPEAITDLILKGYNMTLDLNLGLWGINLNNDPKIAKRLKPFQFHRSILGPFFNIVDTSLRFDETITLKEDYDFFLQNIQKYSKALRFDLYHYKCNHQTLAGGCSTYRTKEKEKENMALLIKKWGSKIVSETENEDDINPVIRL